MTKADVQTLRRLLATHKLEPYIRHIRFPIFKNLSADTRIEFSFPITALVGTNGTNKSSILRAVQGAPINSNLGNYWFSTAVDPIVENPDGRNCFIYGYYNTLESKIVEVLKTRISKQENQDYWEPSRPIAKYDMEEFSATIEGSSSSQTRWDPISKNIIYIDFRQYLSAFDKYFYQTGDDSIKDKKAYIRRCSPHLKNAIKYKRKNYDYYIQRIINKENKVLSSEETQIISEIIGKKYKEIHLLRHRFFKNDGYTAVMVADNLSYSEAFAGSGEFAVVNLVSQIFSAPDLSLILLDEPEVSLHPGAQQKLMIFIRETVLKKKHQVIMATHSPAIIRHLPPDAIKVFSNDRLSQKFELISQESLPEEAFFHIGEPASAKKLVVVEDKLAEKIVKKALTAGGEALFKSMTVRYFPGGSKTLWGHYLPVFAAEKRTDVLVLFDGDERPLEELPDPDSVGETKEADLKEALEKVTRTSINFNVDGGSGGRNVKQERTQRREFIKWVRQNVDYLPGTSTPEAFVWEHMTHDADTDAVAHEADMKKRFTELARLQLGREYEDPSSDDILDTQERCLRSIKKDNEEMMNLLRRLRNFSEGVK